MAYKHKRSSTAGNVPAASVLQSGEIAVNFADKSIYTKDASGIVVELSRDVYKKASAPTSPAAGDLWYDTVNKTTKVWNGTSWVSLGGSSSGATFNVGDTTAQAALSPNNGDLFYVEGDTNATENGRMYIWDTAGTVWIEISTQTKSSLDFRYVQRAGDIMVAGATIELGRNPAAAMEAVTLQYLQLNTSQVTVATSAPASPGVGDTWIDNTAAPSITNVWNGSAWEVTAGTAATISDFTEAVQDVVGGFVYGGNNATVSYSDSNNSVTISSKNSTLAASAPAIAQTGDIWFNTANNQLSYYNSGWQLLKIDATNTVFTSTAGLTSTNVSSALDELKTSLNGLPETIQDTIGASLVSGNNINIIYNDPAGTITITADNVVKKVNGVGPDTAGNVTIVMGQVYSGTLANKGSGGSAAAVEGDNYVVQGDATAANNGKMFIYDGATWLEVGMIPPPKAYIGPTATPPSTPWSVGDLWWNSDKGVLLIYYDDGSSSQWVPATPSSLAAPAGGGGGGGSGTVTSIIAGTGLTGGTITSSGTIALAGSGVSPGTYQGITIDVHGRATGAVNKSFVVGPATASDMTIARYDAATTEPGKLIQGSGVMIDDGNNMTGVSSIKIDSIGGWGGNNYGKGLYITSPGLSNPTIGLSDSSGTNNIAISNGNGRLSIAHMPVITDSTTPPVERIVLEANGNIGFGQPIPLARVDVNGLSAHNVGNTPASGVLDLSLSNMFVNTVFGAMTFSFTNVPANRGVTVILCMANAGAHALTWPTSVRWPGGTAPMLGATGVSILVFVTYDGGSLWHGNVFGKYV